MSAVQYWSALESLSCPFFTENNFGCGVSTSTAHITAQRQHRHCLTDDHDQCAFYLAKILRQSQAKSTESLLGAFIQK